MGVVFIQQNNRHEKVFVGHRLCAYAVGDSAIRTTVRSTGDPGECGSDDKGVRTRWLMKIPVMGFRWRRLV